jgi:hypothetical protein
MLDNNPLRQYFRRPALYLKLPSGGIGYPAGAIDMPDNGELPIYPMTAIDEITCRTPDALYNGSAVTEIIKSCVPNIKNPWAVNNIDLDPLLVAIKIATSGNQMETDTACPKCDEEAKYDVDLGRILAGFRTPDYHLPLSIGELEVKFKPLSYDQLNKANEAQFQAQKLMMDVSRMEDQTERNHKTSQALISMNEMAIDVMSYTIEYIKTPEVQVSEREYIMDYLKNCDSKIFDRIKDRNLELRRASETKPLMFKCIHCQNEYEQPFTINMTNFFE